MLVDTIVDNSHLYWYYQRVFFYKIINFINYFTQSKVDNLQITRLMYEINVFKIYLYINKGTYNVFKALTSSGLVESRFAKNSGVSVLIV